MPQNRSISVCSESVMGGLRGREPTSRKCSRQPTPDYPMHTIIAVTQATPTIRATSAPNFCRKLLQGWYLSRFRCCVLLHARFTTALARNYPGNSMAGLAHTPSQISAANCCTLGIHPHHHENSAARLVAPVRKTCGILLHACFCLPSAQGRGRFPSVVASPPRGIYCRRHPETFRHHHSPHPTGRSMPHGRRHPSPAPQHDQL